MRLALTALLALLFHGGVVAQVRWMTWEEAMSARAEEPRKIFVDVYTDWCGWCKRMDQTTFSDPEVSAVLSRDFYAVKLDAEQRGELDYAGETYAFRPGGRRGVHELAVKLLGGRLGYPSVVFLDEEAEVIEAIPGYQEPAAFEKIVTYFGTDAYRTTPWVEYAGR